MLVSSGFDELQDAKMAIDHLNETEPSIYQKFLNIIQLTRQLQFGYQYMGALLMDEDPTEFLPIVDDDYVLSLYNDEIDKLKADEEFLELKQLLMTYKEISYANISRLALGDSPRELVGPTVIH